MGRVPQRPEEIWTKNGASIIERSPCLKPPNHTLKATARKKKLKGYARVNGAAVRLSRAARGFTDSDSATSTSVALVNYSLARRYFPGEDPIGKMIQPGLPREIASSGQSNDRLMIVGVVADAMNRGVALPTEPEIVGLCRQLPDLNFGFKNLLVRTTLDPLQLSRPIRQQLHSLDANLPFAEVSTMNEIMSAQTADRRYTTGLLVLFAVFGVGLSIVGVYGVISYVVTQRTAEIVCVWPWAQGVGTCCGWS